MTELGDVKDRVKRCCMHMNGMSRDDRENWKEILKKITSEEFPVPTKDNQYSALTNSMNPNQDKEKKPTFCRKTEH